MDPLREFRYVLFPSTSEAAGAKDANEPLNEAYRLWRSVWSETFAELDGNPTVFSDEFTRQSLIGAIFSSRRCVALGLFHHVDFSQGTAPHDSYFKVWPEGALGKLLEDGRRVLVGSNITVDPQFRGELDGGVRMKNLILALMVRTLLGTDADVMTGTMRCNRGMHEAAYQVGATPIQSGILHHGVEVDLVAFYRRRLLEPGALPRDLHVERLWRGRTELGTSTKERETA